MLKLMHASCHQPRRTRLIRRVGRWRWAGKMSEESKFSSLGKAGEFKELKGKFSKKMHG